MDIELEKSEIVRWVQKLKDIDLIQKIKLLKKKSEKPEVLPSLNKTRKAGDGKYLVSFIADDFEALLDDFKDSMPS
ncbi:MAG: hypothetical protein ACKODM_02090 [Cytophagales bacterium]